MKEMQKINKILLAASVAFVVLIVGVLTQSYVRTQQRLSLVYQIKKQTRGLSRTNADAGKFTAILRSYQERIEYLKTHRPILNLNLDFSKS